MNIYAYLPLYLGLTRGIFEIFFFLNLEMVRGKIQMKRIEKATSRQVTFSKRRNGLLKKAYELSVLCDAEVAVIIFSQKGRVYEFSSSDMQKTIERYHKYIKEAQTDKPEMERYTRQLRLEAENMARKIELLEVSQRKLLGQSLGSCSVEELLEVESQLERSLRNIRARKGHLFKEQMEQLKAKERFLREENAKLSAKVIHHSKIFTARHES
ncbi:MADS-box protein AGL42-like [Durio zibethinus]|uniref:MADS-box protein AGL42-like n=1 Tax=Durio zibethinus TaxID=66656 RepID=A0A6P5Y4J4_DURZI|nr:MADS-box protein AGL42-like [Durio zibethinus]